MSQTRAQLVKGFSNTSASDDAVTVDSSGKLGLGTTSPKRQLHINGGDETVKIQLTNTTTGSGTDGDGFQISIASNGNAYLEQRENLPLIFTSNNTERCRILAAGGLTFNGDTAAANALDDYEEGTWTPTCASDGNIGSSQYTNTYTKIGRLVTINCDIHALDNITSTNPIKIGGLPFTPSATSGELGSAATHGERYGTSVITAFLAYMSSQWVIRFRKGIGSSSYEDVDHSDINNAGDNNLRFSLTYEITA